MDEEIFNMQIRKFLKNVGVTSQREIETAVRAALEDGTLKGEETVQAKVTLTIESLGVSAEINGSIDLA
jgi:ribosomal protein L1